MEKFWLLLVDGSSTSTWKHWKKREARKEAERLLSLPENREKGVTILEAISYGGRHVHPVRWVELQEESCR